MKKVILKPRKDEAVKRYHPWVFSGAIKKLEGDIQDGDTVEVFSNEGEYLATGHFQFGSISVRLFSFEKMPIDASFWKMRLQNALNYRRLLSLVKNGATNCYRFVHAEGDNLPGLVIDVYGKTAVMQCHSIGMHREREALTTTLTELEGVGIEAVYDKSKETLPEKYAANVVNSYLKGTAEAGIVKENGHAFFVDWESGQKTGFFLDQRENRRLLSQFVQGKTVLNAFSYSGGFSIYALKAGASLIHSVDSSQKAIAWLERNLAENQILESSHQSFVMDVAKYLKDCPVYDVVVVDPPAFAKSLDKRHNAIQAYKRLNVAAMQKVAPGGVLFTFSCSQVVDRNLFYNTIVAAAIEAGRQVRVMQHLSQPSDHPVSLFHPEGGYLKGLALAVD